MEEAWHHIFEFNGNKYLMTVDYYSRFPVIRLLNDMTSHTVCNHFISVMAEYGLPATIIADFGSQYISEKFKTKCEQSGITLHCSSPYYHQANSLAEKAIGPCKALLRKALEENKCPYTALWIHRTTPLDDQVPSPHELMFGRKPQTTFPRSKSKLKSKHPDDDLHQEANQRLQERQAVFYNRKTGSDKRPLNNQEPLFVWNALKRTWQPATVLNRPQPTERPRSYAVDIQEKIHQRTRQHLRPRRQSKITPPANNTSPPAGAVASVRDPKDAHTANDRAARLPPLSEGSPKDSTPTPEQPPSSKLPCSERRVGLEPASTFAASERTCYQPKNQVTWTGRVTQVPVKFKD